VTAVAEECDDMNPKTVLKVDRYVGKPLCFALTAARKVGSLLRPRRAATLPPPLKRILFIKMIEQGATVLAYRAIARAVERVGAENVYFLVFSENRPILDLLNVIPSANVIEVNNQSLFSTAVTMVKALVRIRSLRIDATVDMEFFARAPAIIGFLSGARRRVGLHRFTSEGPYRGDLLTHRVAHNPYLHAAVAYYVLVEALEADPDDLPLLKRPAPRFDPAPPRFKPAEQELTAMRKKIDLMLPGEPSGDDKPPRRPIVLLNPNVSDMLPLRRWATERFIELARRLLEYDPNLLIIFTGGKSERDASWRIVGEVKSGRAISLAGQTSLRELLVLFSLADVLVTNDSGPGHFAALTPINTVVLFGPETPALFGPVGENQQALYAGLACSPCVSALNHRFSLCKNNVCMQAITVEQVYEKVVAILRPGAIGAVSVELTPDELRDIESAASKLRRARRAVSRNAEADDGSLSGHSAHPPMT
jgi:ADP-heptose:LPS heptosyltransferase